MKAVYVAGARITPTPAMRIAVGGEAEVYDLGDDRALKLFKSPDHPDLASAPADQQAARARLAAHQSKLPGFPGNLPARVVVPRELAMSARRRGQIVGYTMDRIDAAELLYRYGEPRLRRTTLPGNRVANVLRDLCSTVAALHARAIVIGDFNDLNVLVAGDHAYLIDADSFQFGPYACPVFSERFVDPLLCDPAAQAPVLVERHRASSDWYAFTVMAMRSLLCVGPYGGVHRPRDPKKRIAQATRPLRRVTVFDPEVVYPRPALHYSVLPDQFLAHLHATFVADRRDPFPVDLLDDLCWTRCPVCASEHARLVCPACQGKRGKNPSFSRVRGRVRVDEVVTTSDILLAAARVADSSGGQKGRELAWLRWDGMELCNQDGVALVPRDTALDGLRGASDLATLAPAPGRSFACHGSGALVTSHGRLVAVTDSGALTVRAIDACAGDASGESSVASNQRHVFWTAGGQLWRDGQLGDVALGTVVAGQTRIFAGARLGLGFYRVGALCTGFLFDGDRRGITDGIVLPRIRGQIIAAHCVMAETRAWLAWTEARNGRAWHGCALLTRDGRDGHRAQVVATAAASPDESDLAAGGKDDTRWLAHVAGACALGDYLFVPGDDGVQRIEADGERLRVTRSFPDTEPFVDAATRLIAGSRGLYAVSRHSILHLTLSR